MIRTIYVRDEDNNLFLQVAAAATEERIGVWAWVADRLRQCGALRDQPGIVEQIRGEKRIEKGL